VGLAVGRTLVSVTDTTAVVILQLPEGDVTVTCGGAEMVEPERAPGAPRAKADAEAGPGTQLGKRYENADGTLELLCTRAGTNTLAVNGTPLRIKAAKPLPASD
jgi:hypothetical protein